MNMVDTILALSIGLLLMSSIASMMHMSSEKTVQKRAAEEIMAVSEAARHYAERYHATLLPHLSPAGGRSVTVEDLIDDGLLAPGTPEENVWGQTYGIYFRRVDTTVPDGVGGTRDDYGVRVVVLTEGGYKGNNIEEFNNRTVPGTLDYLTSGGAYVASGQIPNQPAGTLIGTGWRMPLGTIGVPDPGPGHLGMVTLYTIPNMTEDYLYRVEVGPEELNTMFTEIHLDDHAILETKEMQFVPHTLADMANFCATGTNESQIFQMRNRGLYICRDGEVHEILDTGNALQIKDMTLVGHGYRIAKPECAPHTDSLPEISITPIAMAAQTEKTPSITTFQAFAVDGGDYWQVILRMQDSKSKEDDPNAGWRYPDKHLVMGHAITFCRSAAMTP